MEKVKGVYKRREGRWEARFKVGVNEKGRAVYRSVYAQTKEEVIAKRKAITREDEKDAGPRKMNLLILGAGTHGKDVYDIAKSLHLFSKIRFLDDEEEGELIIGKCADVLKFKQEYPCAFVAIGNNQARRKFAELLKDYNFLIPSIVSPDANVSPDATIGEGVAILPQATVNDAEIGDFCILASNSLVNRNAKVGKYVHIDCGGMVLKEKKIPEGKFIKNGTVFG